jgi:tetratricopeptide (TPR) repeat protein
MRHRLMPFAVFVLLLFTACSTQKNTWSSRRFQAMNTRFNVYFNGNEAYKKGMEQLKTGFKEDYSNRLPLYQVSNHTLAKGTAANMDLAIEKCQKAIKKHSIRVRPKKKPSAWSSEQVKLFYRKEEFNPFMDNVFLLMANAQFHKTDFLSASSTCSYIIRHFSTDKKLCDRAGILMARAYTELEWYYDAENILDKLNKENLTPSLTAEFSSANADLLIRRGRYAEALPYLEIAVKKAKKKVEKHRWSFLLGQLYQETGEKNKAYQVFNTIPGMNPPYEMELSARIRQTEVYPDANPQKSLKQLLRLSQSNKNTEYLDQVYYAMGNLYFTAKDTVKALEYMHKALDKSAQNSAQKLKIQLALGDYYYKNELFIEAEYCYSDAMTLLNKEDERYELINQRAEMLKELAPSLKTIFEEDSLQAVAKMPEKERNQLIADRIDIAKEKAKEDTLKENAPGVMDSNTPDTKENAQKSNSSKGSTSVPEISVDKSWYFYNPTTVAKGLKDFQKKWGQRSLKDDWRRSSKTTLFETTGSTANVAETTREKTPADSSKAFAKNSVSIFAKGAEDPLNPNYYLQNLPFTEEQLKTSNDKIADALFQAGLVYREKMENDVLALKAFCELESRFPQNKNLENAWYIMYLMLKQQKQDAWADSVRIKQITLFPEGALANRLSNPLYMEKLKEMYQVQDTLYAQAYQNYLQHETDSLFSKGNYVAENYPISNLRPKFAFLQAMESARIGHPEEFHRLLMYIVETYPNSDLVPTIKEMLVFWDAGQRPVPSAGYTNLLSVKDVQDTDNPALSDSSRQFQFHPAEAHILLLAYPNETTNINRLQFDVALYNFTNFLIRDYELSFAKVGKMDVLLIRGFENAEDVVRYRSSITFQSQKPEEKYPGLAFIIVSESNLKLLEDGVSTEEYQRFFSKNYADIKPNL